MRVTNLLKFCLKPQAERLVVRKREREKEIAWYIILQPTKFLPENEFEIVLMLWFQIDFNNIVDLDIF